MFVGAGGIGRIVQRTADLMREHDTDDVGPYGGIALGTIQRYLNLHFSVSLDLFGAESSTNAANYYAAGLKGRFQESAREDDHRLHESEAAVPVVSDDRLTTRTVPALSALNATLRDDYIEDCSNGLSRWNRILAKTGAPPLELPHPGFNRNVGAFAGHHISVAGHLLNAGEWEARRAAWLPTEEDREHVASLMVPVTEPGRMASWVAPPSSGIATKPIDFEYVRAS